MLIRIILIIILIFNGIGAIYGGGTLIIDPSGDLLQLPSEYIEGTIFGNYLIPGIILFSIMGIGSLVAASLAIFRKKNYAYYSMLIGIALMIWIITQAILLQVYFFLQPVFGSLGIVIFILSFIELKRNHHINPGY